MKSEFKTAIILGMILVTTAGILSIAFSSLDSSVMPAPSGDNGPADKSGLRMAPDIVGIAHYLNTTPEKLAQDMEGKVVLYDIWTYSCINCIRTLPHITAWHDKYSEEGLLIIGIHSPEFEFEKDPDNVRMAIDKYGISYPVVMDNDWETWNAFENRYWPRKYIADHEGFIRYDHIGEGAYRETEGMIQKLLRERAASLGVDSASAVPLVDIEEFKHSSFKTPEIYFGYKLAQGRSQLGSDEGFRPDMTVTYKEPKGIELHKFYPVGTWTNTPDSMRLESGTGSVWLDYHAKEVNIVTAGSAEMRIFLDGEALPLAHRGADVIGDRLAVSEPQLYNIISSDEPSGHTIYLEIEGADFEIFTFTFG